MKFIKLVLLSICAVAVLATTGCIFPGHRGGGDYRSHQGYRGYGDYREHSEYRSYPEAGVNIRIHAE